jgi:tetratricopeptide (TPR) repeat protein
MLLCLWVAGCAGGMMGGAASRPKLTQKSSDGVLSPTAAARFLEGEILMLEGRAEEAVKAYSAALAMDAKNSFLEVSLAQALWRAKHEEKAAKLLDKVLEKDPADEFALNVYGLIFAGRKDVPKAEAFFRKATEAAPGSPEAWLNLIALYRENGDVQAAFDAAEALIAAAPGFPDGYAESAQLAFELGLVEKSQERSLEFIEHAGPGEDEAHAQVLLAQGKKMLEAGEASFALVLLKAYRDLFPDDTSAIEAVVSALLAVGRLDEARAAARDVMDETQILKAQLLYETGAYGEALALVEKLPGDAGESDPAVLLIKTVGYAEAMEVEKARGSLALFAPADAAWRTEALEKFLVLLYTSGMETQARELLLGDPAAGSALATFEVFRAVALDIASGRWKNGAEALAKKLPGNAAPLVGRWSALLGGEAGEAAWFEDNLDAVIQAETGEIATTARIVKAILLGEGLLQANPNQLLDLVVKIKSADPACAMIPALQARFYHLVGNRDRAAVWYEKAGVARPADAQTLLWHAELLMETKEEERAAAMLETALLLHPPLSTTKRILSLLE